MHPKTAYPVYTIASKLAVSKMLGGGLFRSRVCGDDHFLTTSFLHSTADRSELRLPFSRPSLTPYLTELYINMDTLQSSPDCVNNRVPGLVELARDPPTAVCDAPP
jgi:hypothetical protein